MPDIYMNDWPPFTVPTSQVTTFPFAPPWTQLPFVLVILSCGSAGGLWMTPTPQTPKVKGIPNGCWKFPVR